MAINEWSKFDSKIKRSRLFPYNLGNWHEITFEFID